MGLVALSGMCPALVEMPSLFEQVIWSSADDAASDQCANGVSQQVVNMQEIDRHIAVVQARLRQEQETFFGLGKCLRFGVAKVGEALSFSACRLVQTMDLYWAQTASRFSAALHLTQTGSMLRESVQHLPITDTTIRWTEAVATYEEMQDQGFAEAEVADSLNMRREDLFNRWYQGRNL